MTARKLDLHIGFVNCSQNPDALHPWFWRCTCGVFEEGFGDSLTAEAGWDTHFKSLRRTA